MRFSTYFLAIAILTCPVGASRDEAPPKVGDIAPDFTLKDAEDQSHPLKKLRGKVVFLILGNRKIRKEDDKWAEAFQKDYGGREGIVAYIIADMRSVPGFVPKRFIKRQLRKNKPPVTLLLDWKGEIHNAYHTDIKKPNLFLIAPNGSIVFHAKSDFDEKTYEKLKAAISKIKPPAKDALPE
ncbi:MAG: redoxin domain-containing protein [Candidatus Poribacteria bacterium]|nr:redoxin domain-containing protein [Candidatus Poribacteria bacterium]MDE0502560.1 redoxin domain-containing protein [Candidatus Poribacteria bacterium]